MRYLIGRLGDRKFDSLAEVSIMSLCWTEAKDLALRRQNTGWERGK